MIVVIPGQVREMSAFINVRQTTASGMMSLFSVSTLTYLLIYLLSYIHTYLHTYLLAVL